MNNLIINKFIEVAKKMYPEDFIESEGEMYSLPPDKNSPGGTLGINLYVNGKKVFLSYQMCEDAISYGEILVADFMELILFKIDM